MAITTKKKPLAKRKPRKVAQPKPQAEIKQMEPNPEIEVKDAESPAIEQPKPKSAARRERIPLGAPRLKLSAPVNPGYRRRWVNDVGGRVEQAESGGYEFVTDTGLKIGETAVNSGNQDLGSRISRIVGTMPDGQPQRAYLMEIKDEFYNEDQREKQRRLDKIDNQIRTGTFNPDNDNDTNRYVPSEGISVK